MRGRPHSLEWWIGVVRLSAVPFAVLQVSLTKGLSSADQRTAWLLVAALAVGAVVLFATRRRRDVAPPYGDLDGLRLLDPRRVRHPLRVRAGDADEAAPPDRRGRRRDPLRDGRRDRDRARVRAGRRSGSRQRRADLFDTRFRTDYVTFQAGAGPDHGQPRRLARQPHRPRARERRARAPRRRRSCATSSAAAPICSTLRTAAREPSTRRSISTRHSARSSASCAGSCPSTAWRSCSPRRAWRT